MGYQFTDPLGFTKQTETILRCIGATDLINTFKQRNVSTTVLHKLNKQDFMNLGANEDQADEMLNFLRTANKHTSITKPKPYQKIGDHVNILEEGKEHLNFMKLYLRYCKVRLEKVNSNFFIDPDFALSASTVLYFSADSILKEIQEAELKLNELEVEIKKPTNKYSYIFHCIQISGGIAVGWIILKKFWS